jgi:hypothetical protein
MNRTLLISWLPGMPAPFVILGERFCKKLEPIAPREGGYMSVQRQSTVALFQGSLSDVHDIFRGLDFTPDGAMAIVHTGFIEK